MTLHSIVSEMINVHCTVHHCWQLDFVDQDDKKKKEIKIHMHAKANTNTNTKHIYLFEYVMYTASQAIMFDWPRTSVSKNHFHNKRILNDCYLHQKQTLDLNNA